jgi:hypothetical protein
MERIITPTVRVDQLSQYIINDFSHELLYDWEKMGNLSFKI